MSDSVDRTDRRYQVFISSTFSDLNEERKAAVEGVFERGHIPIALERFSPANDTDLHVIKNAMRDSQVYVLILGHRYGHVIPGKEISFTEYEYDLAQEYGLFTLIFLMKPDVISERRSKLDSNNTKDREEIHNAHKLSQFHDKIKNHFRKLFAPGPDFKYIVELALSDALQCCNKPGFIREPADLAIIEGAKNEFISDLVTELRSFEKLYRRTQQQSDKKRGVSRFFVQKYIDRLVHNKVSMFFESGSTPAFLAKEMSPALSEAVTITDDGSPSLQIGTNNILAYLLLWLKARIPCTKFPWSPPVEATYGAAYGILDKLHDSQPDYSMPPLDGSARREIARLLNAQYTLTSYKRPVLLVGAASGLQLTANHKIRFVEAGLSENRKDELRVQISQCYGPHVGSYHNKIFKRFMYETKLPLVLFITGEKIDCEIEAGRCHFMFDRELSWDTFHRNHPLAICVGCSDEEKAGHIQTFRSLDFDIIDENSASPISSFIARNQPFIDEFESVLSIGGLGPEKTSV